MSVKAINKYIKILDDEVLQITVKFAENNLSKICLNYADYKSDKYYEWTLGSTAYAVFFELPTLFNVHIQDIYSLLTFYCMDYCQQKGINADNFIALFQNNCKKEIVYKDN